MSYILGVYKNGNYTVTMLSDGTKIRSTNANEFIPAFAENCDCKITDRCDGGCAFCYEGCTPTGSHADLLSAKWVDSLHPYTELALNGNDLSHPQLIPFLHKLKEKKVIANLTVNQIHFEKNYDFLKTLVEDKLIWGLGVSLKNPTDEFITKLSQFKNAVLHVINGILTEQDVVKLSNNNIKMLILGYKVLGRGENYATKNFDLMFNNQEWLYKNLPNILDKFAVVSFDNLAIEQLDVKRLMSEKEWEEFYMGDDGGFTFYIDMVKGVFSKNSIAPQDERHKIGVLTVDEMFQKIRGIKNNV